MYPELKKYKTNKTRPCTGIEQTTSNSMTFTYQESEYIANVGDLINDFINHKNKPFWKRKYYDDHLTKLYIKMLNHSQITHWM